MISFEFASPIGPSLANAANSLAGYIDIDIDQNAATGFAPLTDRFRIDGGSTGMAVEYVVDLFQNDDGSMSIYSQSDVARCESRGLTRCCPSRRWLV